MWVMRFFRCLVAYKPTLKTPDGSAEAIKIRGSLSDLFFVVLELDELFGQHPHKNIALQLLKLLMLL